MKENLFFAADLVFTFGMTIIYGFVKLLLFNKQAAVSGDYSCSESLRSVSAGAVEADAGLAAGSSVFGAAFLTAVLTG